MPISAYNQDTLVQQTTVEYLEQELDWTWESVTEITFQVFFGKRVAVLEAQWMTASITRPET
ncbi:MAG: hypothetical protein OQK67_07230 [Chlorobium sp.]|nr:hypothetical protein [Chlorobium sp.]MCW8815892.1 hypothetical protein [Chlorobium sp.]